MKRSRRYQQSVTQVPKFQRRRSRRWLTKMDDILPDEGMEDVTVPEVLLIQVNCRLGVRRARSRTGVLNLAYSEC